MGALKSALLTVHWMLKGDLGIVDWTFTLLTDCWKQIKSIKNNKKISYALESFGEYHNLLLALILLTLSLCVCRSILSCTVSCWRWRASAGFINPTLCVCRSILTCTASCYRWRASAGFVNPTPCVCRSILTCTASCWWWWAPAGSSRPSPSSTYRLSTTSAWSLPSFKVSFSASYFPPVSIVIFMMKAHWLFRLLFFCPVTLWERWGYLA